MAWNRSSANYECLNRSHDVDQGKYYWELNEKKLLKTNKNFKVMFTFSARTALNALLKSFPTRASVLGRIICFSDIIITYILCDLE